MYKKSESEIPEDNDSHTSNSIGVGMGIAIGTAIGVATDNLALWLSLGVAIGIALGSSGAFSSGEKGKQA